MIISSFNLFNCHLSEFSINTITFISGASRGGLYSVDDAFNIIFGLKLQLCGLSQSTNDVGVFISPKQSKQ